MKTTITNFKVLFKILLGLTLSFLLCHVSLFAQEILKDPMQPFSNSFTFTTSSPQLYSVDDNWLLSLVLLEKNRRVAILNGQIIKVGDLIQNAKVSAIELHAVILQQGDIQRRIELHFNQ